MRRSLHSLALAGAILITPRASEPPHAANLRLVEIGADSTAFDVVATIIVGPTEAVLWDAQYHAPDARRLADAVQATGKHLKAIVLSHADEDHVSGLATILERFPNTPVYISSAGLAKFTASAVPRFKADKAQMGALLPDSLPMPVVLPSTTLAVDGETIEVIPDLTGDVITPSNSALWIPSLRTVLAGDIVFNDVHPWLGSSDSASRVAWRTSLKRLASLSPAAVVAGHKKDVTAPDSPELLDRMTSYLDDFDALLKDAKAPPDIRDKMLAKYPTYGVPILLNASSGMALRRKMAGAPPAP